jgi:hypothetical protein
MKMLILELIGIIAWTVCAVLNYTVAWSNPLYWVMFGGDILLILMCCINACLIYNTGCKQAKAAADMEQ